MLVSLYPLPNPVPAHLFPTRPMRKCSVASNGSKTANQRANFAVSSPQRFILEKWPCWLLAQLLFGSAGPYPPIRWLGKKQMALFTKKIITLRKKWVKLAHSPFPTARQSQLAPLTSHSALFAGQPDKGQIPLLAHGQNDLQPRAFDPSPLIITQEI